MRVGLLEENKKLKEENKKLKENIGALCESEFEKEEIIIDLTQKNKLLESNNKFLKIRLQEELEKNEELIQSS